MKFKYYEKSKVTLILWITLFSVVMFSCSEDEDLKPDEEEILPPIELPCNYFTEDRVLVNDPQRPVDYLIDCYMNISGSTSINIEPGVVIAFESDAGMRIAGTTHFEAVGTSSEPIIFTGTSKNKGHWRGLMFYSSNSNNVLQYALIEYAGGKEFSSSSPVYGGSIAVAHETAISFDHVTISKGKSHGMQLTGRASSVATANLKIAGNDGVPVQVAAYQAHILDESSEFYGNSSNFVNIVSDNYEIKETVSWKKLDVPYLVDSRVHLNNNGHLTIEAGAEVQFKPQGYLQAASSSNSHNVSLKIKGTADEPVHLKAHNGSNWGGIYYAFTQEENVIDHAVIEHAKGDYPVGNKSNSGAIYMHANPKLQISNTTFKDLPNYAAYAYTGASTSEPELPNFSASGNTYINVAKGDADLGYLGWGNGSSNHNP
ncbi:hypothetical protein [Sunxiuqinia elliptica]|uniref:Right handed beta helix region n=1 Tax=Sunxiuqinia elliptica TaxID=655355 RepID=A0A4R6H3N0_9BACT|nr:hypothetical protein [Sunxiuqinia elliptica]TDO02783.1 hypothetical protein DET52_104250 [Sunxiuqinia elliptica]TDO58478.1 hypothetical protein DET65_3001 [Sunxiuqinia elliptica]